MLSAAERITTVYNSQPTQKHTHTHKHKLTYAVTDTEAAHERLLVF